MVRWELWVKTMPRWGLWVKTNMSSEECAGYLKKCLCYSVNSTLHGDPLIPAHVHKSPTVKEPTVVQLVIAW